jgi:hypothetical protein
MLGGIIGDILVIVSILTVLISLAIRGLVPPYLVVLALILLVFLRARGRVDGGTFGSIIRGAFSICLPILSLAILLIKYGNGNWRELSFLSGSLIALFLVVLGVYVIIWGAFTSPKGIAWNILGLLSIMVFVIDLAAAGYINASWAAGAIVLLVFLNGLGHFFRKRSGETAHKTFSLTFTLLSLAAFLFIVLGSQRGAILSGSLASFGTLIIVLIGLYVIFLGSGFRQRH